MLVGGALLLLLAAPLYLGSYWTSTLILVFFYAYTGQCWNILGGYAGQVSLGHAAFLGIGAYTSTALFMFAGLTPWLGMLAGGVLAALLGLCIGFVSFRFHIRGAYFILITLAFAEIFHLLALHLESLGGAQGLFVPFTGASWAKMQFKGNTNYYYVALALLVVITLVARALERSKLGLYLVAIREDEDASRALGVNTMRCKLAATAISAFFTALAGAFYSNYFFYIHPDEVLDVELSVDILLRPIVGGAGTLFGPIVGSFILTPLAELSRAYFSKEGLIGTHLIIYGLLLIAVVLFFPRGVAPYLARLVAGKRTS
ncbi:MAG: branched-chain amino acid ABC transporter permease [Candidatus Tectomicrobia bacterium]|nr:branched-chain amino acid ABC transporter permease [Candidatus Tectomicrobia bacterium]